MSICIKEVGRTFGAFTALDKINLIVEDGEFLAILGPSGCGKTTLLRLLAGFDAPTAGTIEMDGRIVGSPRHSLPPEQRNIGMVFQSFALWPHMNVRKHIEFSLLHHQYVRTALKKEYKQRTDEVLRMIKLQHFADRMPAELSGGQKQRVALGRAIAPQPKLLLMDEPLSSLDAELRIAMRGELQDIHRLTGATIIYVTHDQSEALAMADRMVVMNRGTVEQIGTPKEIYMHPKTDFVARFVGKANLIKGTWTGKTFSPDEAPDSRWPDPGVSELLKKQAVYPARPEQLALSRASSGIPATVTNVQYQGKEIHYTVRTNGGIWRVDTDLSQNYDMGDSVFLKLKSTYDLSAEM
ncbi:ABC transporter ATP-binding protein [Sporolactobacillus sp. CPB3-1]|uniref:ABC transporter ATP-binding protein n=1 Tax=Sporolactobacillus mangiferae TaxID=2940498 RepID=A0ABT0MAV7_9BACL|nr:ABC transporter ATP-binding protein [Sporolactobacillus mangiferae]MCL1632010.1 ABC transporter ATP-binding protein [Sporolactobacillus mangiferae]